MTFICAVNGIAQIPQSPITALSPNAASLGVYGDIPVSLYTGTPEISIPLYDIKVKDFTMPISLSYHAAGIRVDQRPGWTGLGWTLFAGGAITRSVKDIPDEYNNPNYYFGGNFGYYYTYNVLNVNNWNDRTYLRSIAQSDQGTLADTDPDEFSFNFTGYSGKFYLNHKREWVVQCNKPVKVEFNETFLQIPFDKERTRAEIYGYSHCFSGFTLITENGTKYIFGNILMLLIFL